MDDYQQPEDAYALHCYGEEEEALRPKSVRAEFLESVRADNTASLAKRLVALRRRLRRREIVEVVYGDSRVVAEHAEIIRNEIKRRMAAQRAEAKIS